MGIAANSVGYWCVSPCAPSCLRGKRSHEASCSQTRQGGPDQLSQFCLCVCWHTQIMVVYYLGVFNCHVETSGELGSLVIPQRILQVSFGSCLEQRVVGFRTSSSWNLLGFYDSFEQTLWFWVDEYFQRYCSRDLLQLKWFPSSQFSF
jgi:hypothetical protein